MIEDPAVFILDEDPTDRQFFTAATRAITCPVETFRSADDFFAALFSPCNAGRPCCAILSVRYLADKNCRILNRLHQEKDAPPTIVVSSEADVAGTVLAMQSGAMTVLEKPCREAILHEAVEKAIKLDVRLSPKRAFRNKIRRRLDLLSPGEKATLRLLLDGGANASIAEELNVCLRTIEVRRAAIMRKMKAASLVALIRMICRAELEEIGENS